MPQMAPMNWSLLIMMFITLFMIMMMINYFTFQPTMSINMNNFKKNFPKKDINWKW